MEGRPNYAYLKFVAQEVVIDSGLSLSRVRSTCRDVTDYALSNYQNRQISAACITFIELLGQDSLPLRVCLVAANMLHEHQMSDQVNDGSHPEIGRKFKQAHLNKDIAVMLISELEAVILNKWNSFNTEPTVIFQDIILWMPVMSLAHLYKVEAGKAYLDECAKQNSWLKFLVFAQMFQVSKEMVLKSASKFSSSCIYYHIFHALHRKPSLIYDVVYETKSAPSVKTPRKDMRKSLYSRIGVLQGTTPPVPENKKPVDQDDDKCSVSSEETVSSTDTDLKSFVLKDLFSQLLLAHNSDTPDECLLHTSRETKNPTLALLAASYPDSILENCFFTWLYTTLVRDEDLQKILESSFTQKIVVPNVEDIEKLILMAVQNKKLLILYEGVICFLPSTPLVPLMEFLKNFILYKRFDVSIEQFQNQLWNYNKNAESSSVLLSLLWIENISISIFKEAVIGCSTSYEQLILLRHYSHTRLEKSFSKDVVVPPFIKVCKMMEHLGDVAKQVDVKKLLLPEDDVEYGEACWTAVKQLLDRHQYENAQLFGDVAKLHSEKMILLQINQESEEARKSENWGNLLHRVEFWSQLIQRLSASSVTVHATVEFLENQCEISNMFGEKYFLMKSIVEYLNHIFEKTGFYDTRAHNIEAYRKKMWWFCIKAEVNGELLPEIFDMQPLHEFNVLDVTQESENNTHHLEGEKENQALCNIIGYFLCSKNIRKALELAKIFDYDSSDLKIIKKCLQLANNEIDASSIDISLPDPSTEVASSRIISSLVLWICNDSGVTQSQKDVIKQMEQLSMKSGAVVAICHQILVNYSTAMVLSQSYSSISEEKDPFRILKQMLHKKLNDNFILARSFIAVNELLDKDVAKFLSREIWNSLLILSGPSSGVLIPEEKSAFAEELIYDPLQTHEGFQLIVKLCQDSSVLGNSLMDIFSEETVDLNPKTSDKFLSSVVELCICAHECYTAACNMDGISKILHNSQLLVNILEEGKKFNIMIRLLIGLGRYGEMMYVFDILKAHDKFQLLFEANINNASSLRLALQDYLKRCSPSNSDSFSYTLAKRFGMHREKAESLEMSVQKILSRLCKRNTDIDLRKELEDAEQNLSDAAISYCKADCFNQAQHCARLAKLVALQIYFLASGIWIIGLDDTSVCRFITDHDDFSQSLIVAEEYGKDNSWEQALLNNFIIRGDREYLRAFQAHMDLKSSTIRNVAKKFQLLPNKNESLIKNMKHLLSLCLDTKTKFILAKDLGFKDIITELKMKEGSYVRDLFPEDEL
ncbi:spatacsin-like [Uloborus diversus]|uniref:spatacsin-like n=1 Tax=Uloborus diversus TaxID=327109 RepID=UPI00240A9B78|nr:spatacsin-like [Uloborus diversus]